MIAITVVDEVSGSFSPFLSPQTDRVDGGSETANLMEEVKEWALLHTCVMDQMIIDSISDQAK